MKKRTLIILFLAAITLLASAFGSTMAFRADNVDRATDGRRYSIVGYEVANLARLPGELIGRSFDLASGPAQDVQTIRDYLSQVERRNALQLDHDRAEAASRLTMAVAPELERVGRSLVDRSAAVQAAVGSLVTEELRSQGFILNKRVRSVFPPVLFNLEEMPHVLVMSPRSRIELSRTALLSQSLTPDEIASIEKGAESAVSSSLVDRVGGVATYPSLVSSNTSLQGLLSTVAHEWAHQYLFFFPLGSRYGASYELTSINETVADMIGEEIASAILRKQFGQVDRKPSAPAERVPAAFDFNKEMRLTRVAVDSLLSEGQIEEAESYMNERRKTFDDHGYFIRRLNQAYFAWYGSYGASPSVVSPIGSRLRALRAGTSSLHDFVKQVRSIRDMAAFRALVPGA